METLARAQRVSERLTDGRLPKDKTLKMWAGFGNGRVCDGCGGPILGSEVEHEHDLMGGGILRFHAARSVLWGRVVTAMRKTDNMGVLSRINTIFLLIAFTLLTACGDHVRIISDFGSMRGGEGYLRVDGPHNGIDIAGVVGTPVIAAADGVVVIAGPDRNSACGTSVVINHGGGDQTIYCHLSESRVTMMNEVKRGDVIGAIGTTGRRAGEGFEHVHFMLRQQGVPVDPMKFVAGCFDSAKTYPGRRAWDATDAIVLTYPIKCGVNRTQ